MKRIQTFLSAAVMVIVSSFILTACQERDGVVAGSVHGADLGGNEVEVVIYQLDREDDVPGANVFQKGAIVQRMPVDENGSFSFTLPPEEYIVQVWLNSVEVVDQMIEVRAGRTTTLDLEIPPPSS